MTWRSWLARRLRLWAYRLSRPPDRTAFDEIGEAIGTMAGRGYLPKKVVVDMETYHELAVIMIDAGQLRTLGPRQGSDMWKAEGRLAMDLFGIKVEGSGEHGATASVLIVESEDPCLGDCDEDEEGRKINPLTLEPCP